MCLILGIHHMRHTSFDVTEGTVLRCQVAVAHQRDAVAVNADNPVHHIATAVNPCQNHVAYVYHSRPSQDDALLATDDKRQHALPLDGKRHSDALSRQPYGFLYNLVVVHLVIVS